jgi:hypothetical protein
MRIEYLEFVREIRTAEEEEEEDSGLYRDLNSREISSSTFWDQYADSWPRLGQRIFSLSATSASCDKNSSTIGLYILS